MLPPWIIPVLGRFADRAGKLGRSPAPAETLARRPVLTPMTTNPPAPRPVRSLRFWVVLGCAGLGLALVAFSPAVRESIEEAMGWAKGFMEEQGAAGALVFFLFSALSAMLAFASSVVLVPAASLAWGQPLAFLLLWGGWVAGAAVAFGIGRLAQPLLRHTGYEDKLEKYQDYASRRMRFWMVLLFCLAVPSEIPGYLFGSLRYPFLKFLAAIATAEAAYALGVVVAGESLLTDRPIPFLAVIGLLALVAVLAGWGLRATGKGRG